MRKRMYTPDEIDAFAAFSPDTGKCYYLPLSQIGVRSHIQLRLGPTRNNQRLGVHWAEDFEFTATLAPPQGAVAQLGERLAGSQKGTGSSPVGSTLFP
jgi:hypothetical protein